MPLLRFLIILAILSISIRTYGLTQCPGFLFHNDQATQWLSGLEGPPLITGHSARLPSIVECPQLIQSPETVLMYSSPEEQAQAAQYCTGLVALNNLNPQTVSPNCFISETADDLELLPHGSNIVLMSGDDFGWQLNKGIVYRGTSLTLVGRLAEKKHSNLSLDERAQLKPCADCKTDLILTNLTLNLSENALLSFSSTLQLIGTQVNAHGGKLVGSKERMVTLAFNHSSLNRYAADFLEAQNLQELSITHSDISDWSDSTSPLFNTVGTEIIFYNNHLRRSSGKPPALLLTAGFGLFTFRHNDLDGPWQIDLEDNVLLDDSSDNRAHLSQASDLSSYQSQFNRLNDAGDILLTRYTDDRQRRQATEMPPTNSTMGGDDGGSGLSLAIALPVGLGGGGGLLICGMICCPCIIVQCVSETYRDFYNARNHHVFSLTTEIELVLQDVDKAMSEGEENTDDSTYLAVANPASFQVWKSPFTWYFKVWVYSFFGYIKARVMK